MRAAKILQPAGAAVVTGGVYLLWGGGVALVVAGVLCTLFGVALELDR